MNRNLIIWWIENPTLSISTSTPKASLSQEKVLGKTAKEQLENYFKEKFKKHGVCTYQLLKQGFLNLQQSKGNNNLSKFKWLIWIIRTQQFIERSHRFSI